MPPQPQQFVIRKSLVGLLGIYLLGAATTVVFILLSIYIRSTQPDMTILMLVMALVVIVATGVTAYGYNLSRLIISSDKLVVDNWSSLLISNDTVTEWDKVTDINVKERGILAQMFNFGTLTIEAASGDGRLTLPFVPDPYKWRDVMNDRMESAAAPVHEV